MLLVSVSILRKGYNEQKDVVSLPLVPVRIKGVQLTRTNLDFIFSGKNLFLSVRLLNTVRLIQSSPYKYL